MQPDSLGHPARRPSSVGTLSRAVAAILLVACTAPLAPSEVRAARRQERPNVVVVITDDQGYGDVGAHGNRMIKTPNLDRLYRESVRLTDFHVDPTCAPTRSALMTGRYSTRTGVWHTIMGRSLMDPAELTLAEVLREAGYRTAMFGKWHLGDNWPLRPQDQGFEEVLMHGGGGVGQTPDYFGNDYFDDTYFRNGKPEKQTGYCTDVWFDEALAFMEANQGHPFFVYLTTNAPHGPFLVDEKYSRPYEEAGVPATMAKFYGMITNIDENVGRLRAQLKKWKLEEDTVFVFMTDNGTAAGVARGRKGSGAAEGAWRGFNSGMRGQKGSEYDGGHRVPCFVSWPGGSIVGGRDVEQLTAHIDLLPTLAELCGARVPEGVALDGRSLVPLLVGGEVTWTPRTLLVHSQRIETPEKWRKSAVMTERWRLVNGRELYDIQADPGQTQDLAAEQPEVTTRLREAYDAWWESLAPRFDRRVRIGLGGPESPARLTCHDWCTTGGGVPWNQNLIRKGQEAYGFWALDVSRAGRYTISLRRWPQERPGPLEATTAQLKVAEHDLSKEVNQDDQQVTFEVDLPKGQTRLVTLLTQADGKSRGAYFAYVELVEAK